MMATDGPSVPIPFLPDDALADLLRPVETELRERGLLALADVLGEVLRILDPEPRA